MMLKLLDILFLFFGLIVHISIFLVCLPLILSPLWPLGIGIYIFLLYLFKIPTIELWNAIW